MIIKENIHWVVFVILVIMAVVVLQYAREAQGTPSPLYYAVLAVALIITILIIVGMSRK